MVGQIALSSTVLLASMSSTLLLHVVTLPYVVALHEIKPSQEQSDNNLRRFRAKRFNLIGNHVETEFTLGDVSNADVANPFASFKHKTDGYFYIFGGNIPDDVIRKSLTREG